MSEAILLLAASTAFMITGIFAANGVNPDVECLSTDSEPMGRHHHPCEKSVFAGS